MRLRRRGGSRKGRRNTRGGNARKRVDWFDLLTAMPWQASSAVATLLALFAMYELVFIGPRETGAAALAAIAICASAFCAVASWGAHRVTSEGQRLVRRSRNVASLGELTWKDFERLVAQVYRSQGYEVRERLQEGADGGIDLEIRRGNHLRLVQCKQWRSTRVSVSVVREMFGLMHAHGAAGVTVVSMGRFTREALEFAKGKPVELVDGNMLFSMIETARRETR
jgi:restriction system protein